MHPVPIFLLWPLVGQRARPLSTPRLPVYGTHPIGAHPCQHTSRWQRTLTPTHHGIACDYHRYEHRAHTSVTASPLFDAAACALTSTHRISSTVCVGMVLPDKVEHDLRMPLLGWDEHSAAMLQTASQPEPHSSMNWV